MEKIKVSGAMLAQVKAAEEKLAHGEVAAMADSLPEGHPLLDEVAKHRAAGDLDGLPSGHPLIRMLEAAKKAYDVQKQSASVRESASTEIRRAKRPGDAAAVAKKAARVQEASDDDKRRDVAGKLNKGIDDVMGSVKSLYGILAESEELMANNPVNRVRAMRLKRLLFASERGLADCRMSRI